MSAADYAHFTAVLKSRCGIEVGTDKDYLINSRLAPIAAQEGFGDVPALLAALRAAPREAVIAAAVEAMTTNETYFFRDQTPFDHLRRVLGEIVQRRPGAPVRIWSAACSTGQEPYSIAMTADEVPGARIDVLATDLSVQCLNKAKAGIYSAFEVQRGLPIQKLVRYFEQQGDNWQVKPALKQSISWKAFNLLESPRALGRFDVVFCRNVLIYFDRETRARILENIAASLNDGGYLLLGASETVLGLTQAFQATPERPGLFARVSDARPAAAALSRLPMAS